MAARFSTPSPPGSRFPDAFYADLTASLRRKRDLLAAGLRAAGFDVFVPQGTYFITTDIAALGESDGLAFCRGLPQRCGVVAVPNVVFYDDPAAGRTRSASPSASGTRCWPTPCRGSPPSAPAEAAARQAAGTALTGAN